MQITDGRNHNTAKVDSANRVHTYATSQSETGNATHNGDAYNINSGFIAYTGTSESSLIYIKNNESRDLIVTAIAFGIGALSATVTDSALVTVIRNPTGGDVVTDATAVGANANLNFGSSKTLLVDAYAGKDGGTITGGNDVVYFTADGNERVFAPIEMHIPTGSSIGIKVDLNTSGGGNMYGAVVCHLEDVDRED